MAIIDVFREETGRRGQVLQCDSAEKPLAFVESEEAIFLLIKFRVIFNVSS